MTGAPLGAPQRSLAWWGWILILLGGATISLLRQPGVAALDSIWAEDGGVFLSDALLRPLDETVTSTYAGYLHAAPRLMAEIAGLLPLTLAAAVLSGGAALCVSALAIYVWVTGSRIIKSRILLVLLVGSFLVSPVAAYEAANNAGNLHWFLTFAAFWALIDDPSTPWLRISGVIVVVIAALSAPLTLLLIPVAVGRLWLRSWRPSPAMIGFAIAIPIQVIAIALSEAHSVQHPLALAELQELYGARVAVPALLGERVTGLIGEGLPLVGYAAILGLIAISLTTGKRFIDLRLVVGSLLFMSLTSLVLPGLTRDLSALIPEQTPLGYGASRYLIAPQLFAVTLIIIAVDRLSSDGPHQPARIILDTYVVLLAIAMVSTFSVATPRSYGPRWSQELDRLSTGTCTAGEIVEIPIAPRPPWAVRAPCHRL